jgi:hypothetical protein
MLNYQHKGIHVYNPILEIMGDNPEQVMERKLLIVFFFLTILHFTYLNKSVF